MRNDFDPESYWTERLQHTRGLQGVGCAGYSPAYNRWYYRRKRRFLDRVIPSTMARQAALDIGSGVGWVLHYLYARNIKADGCDISEAAITSLQSLFPTGNFFRFHAGKDRIPHAPGSLALVTMLDVVYHIVSDPTWESAVHEIAASLRPGGIFVVTDAFADRDSHSAVHVRFRSQEQWTEIARETGLTCVGIYPYMHYLSRDKGVSRLDHIPDGFRGAIEYGLDIVRPEPAHLHGAVFAKL